MNKKGIIHVLILLLLVLGGDLILISCGITGKAITYLTIPPLYAIGYFIICISRLSYKHYLDGILLLFCAVFVLILPLKITFYYYNIYFFTCTILLGAWFLKNYYSRFISSKFRTITVLLAAINVFLILLPDSVVFEHLNWRSLMWTPNLEWKDFRGKPFGNNQATALLHSNLKWRANRLYNYPAGTVIAFVEPDSSFRRELTDNLTPELRDSLYNVLLKHEQVHFNIAEYYARIANEKIASEWFLSESEVESIARGVYAEYVKKDIEYDSVTNNSINIALQEKWAEAYKSKLNIK